MKTCSIHHTIILIFLLLTGQAQGQTNRTYVDSINSYAISIDTLIFAFDDLRANLSQSIIHYRQPQCGGGGTSYLHEDPKSRKGRIFYDYNCGGYWWEKKFYLKDGKIVLSKIWLQGETLKRGYIWEEYYQNDRLVWTTKKIGSIPGLKKDELSSSLKQGYELLKDHNK
jgi:hypothetical protein